MVFNNLFNWAQRRAVQKAPALEHLDVASLFEKGITQLANTLTKVDEIPIGDRLKPEQIAFLQDYKQLVQAFFIASRYLPQEQFSKLEATN